MTDDQSDISEDLEGELLLGKVDSMLHRHRREQSSLMQTAEKAGKPDEEQIPSEDFTVAGAESPDTLRHAATAAPEADEIPILTDQVTLTLDAWPEQTEFSELLYFAFDAALRETSINLSSAERLTLIQALGKRLPKNL